MKKILFLLAFAGCVTTPSPPPGDECQAACANLLKLACPEGQDSSCVEVCQQAQATRLTDLKPTCLARAKDRVAVRLCGSVDCND
jgi:hypothetical protein